MSLPTINETSFTKAPLPSGKTIGIRPWRVKEEKELLYATDSSTPEAATDTQKEILKFISKCVDSEDTFKTLSNADLLFIAAELRKLSKGSKIDYSYNCPHCKTRNEDQVCLNSDLVVSKFNYDAVEIDNMVITFKDVPYIEMDALFDSTNNNMTMYNDLYLVHSIDTITIDGKLFSNFSIEELIEFIGNFKSNQYDILKAKLEESLSEVKLVRVFPCMRCSHDIDVYFGNLYDFFVF